MNRFWNLEGAHPAAIAAEVAAPFVHARKTGESAARGLDLLTEEELDELCAAAVPEGDETNSPS